MSQVIADELARLKRQKAVLDGEEMSLRDSVAALNREREAATKQLHAKHWQQNTVTAQIEKLEEFLRIED